MLEMVMAPQMEMQANPALLNLARLLTLPSTDLQQVIRQELDENPSLEEIEAEETTCETCGGPLVEGMCLRCLSHSPDLPASAPTSDNEWVDPFLFVAAPRSLTETLLMDLYATLPKADHPLADALVGSLDEQGFLADEPADIAATLQVAPERIVVVLRHLRELGPPGIATRDTRECLLAQIDRLSQDAGQGQEQQDERGEGETITVHPLAASLIEHHLDDLGAHRYSYIARKMHIELTDIRAAHDFIQRHLWPYPALATQTTHAPDQTRYRIPDLAITEKEGEFVVEVLNSSRRLLRMNPLYQELTTSMATATLDNNEREHVQQYVARTRVFLANLRQRESTLKQIGDAIVARQQAFLRHGVRHLRPMTRAEIAAELELHESTVSRAVAEKTALLPNRTLQPLSEFFVAARTVQDVLRELVANETTPLSDEELARILTERGYPIARRTVAKYRKQINILPSNLRQGSYS
jgi:RNA polymerase sigma-54 factor